MTAFAGQFDLPRIDRVISGPRALDSWRASSIAWARGGS